MTTLEQCNSFCFKQLGKNLQVEEQNLLFY